MVWSFIQEEMISVRWTHLQPENHHHTPALLYLLYLWSSSVLVHSTPGWMHIKGHLQSSRMVSAFTRNKKNSRLQITDELFCGLVSLKVPALFELNQTSICHEKGLLELSIDGIIYSHLSFFHFLVMEGGMRDFDWSLHWLPLVLLHLASKWKTSISYDLMVSHTIICDQIRLNTRVMSPKGVYLDFEGVKLLVC